MKFRTVYHIPEELELSNEITLDIQEGKTWNGHSYGEHIGRKYVDGNMKSFFKKDGESGGTELFDKVRNAIPLLEVLHTVIQRDSRELRRVIDYYIQYKPVNHCSTLPTYTENSFSNCMNVLYDVAFEVLFIDEEYKKYLVYEYKTEGPYTTSMMDQVSSLGDLIEEMAEEKENELYYEDGRLQAIFYDDTGDSIPIEYRNTDELLDKVVSIRLIKLDEKLLE